VGDARPANNQANNTRKSRYLNDSSNSHGCGSVMDLDNAIRNRGIYRSAHFLEAAATCVERRAGWRCHTASDTRKYGVSLPSSVVITR